MLTTIISSSINSPSIRSVDTAIVNIHHIGIPDYWSAVIIGLLILLSLMEILAATEKWNRDINCSFNIAIIPLTLSFIGIIIFRILRFFSF